MSILPQPQPKMWIWFLCLGGFYLVWAWLVFYQEQWSEVVSHWPMAAAMAVGSYAAGSTPMGGGSVGFPILVLLFGESAELGRDFSFAVQSIGMSSAAIFIFARRQALAGAMLKGALLGTTIGLPIGIFLVAPWVPGLHIKIIFAVVWGSFGILHLWRIQEIAGHEGMTDFDERWDQKAGFLVGLLAGAAVVSVSGVGVDMALYTVLVLLCRADLKIAIPTSVVIMAFASVLGILTKLAFTGVQPGVYGNWLAAAPVVALGAPLGVFVVDLIGRKPTLIVVAILCVGQLLWTLLQESDNLGALGMSISVLAVGACLLGFERLRIWGARLVGERSEHPQRDTNIAAVSQPEA
ncbi:sulfite exporter TauE/SafE family protein [Verrucomicrobiaceae bacterium 5K15]|uniref:Probable membrane transporter protein n=1 Tax=Oceaniferula flava TaxID=2800421 RepID=A0AAE2SCZ4_9BACT|nr:sulfite exporter TauE/SafE family protein [Oceaniferula flavus]MBK1855574.1 sulfite exporter TauE/SafE family protein [Oceaniferula flavus]MBM1136880.1 sulfite exporter TauE/SafE family protein [Oceaniferula flavus]